MTGFVMRFCIDWLRLVNPCFECLGNSCCVLRLCCDVAHGTCWSCMCYVLELGLV